MMVYRNNYFRNSFLKLKSQKLSLLAAMPFIALLLINLFIITYAFPQQNALTREMFKTQHSLEEEKSMFNWRAAFDELKRMMDSDRLTGEYTQPMAAKLIEMIENESVEMRVASEKQKKEISDDFKKLYLEYINKMRNRSIKLDDYNKFEEKKNDHLKFFDAKYSIVRAYTMINIISLLQSDNNKNADYFLKEERSTLKTLLQEALDEKGSKSREFKLYQELLNSNPRTKSILDRNNKKALSNRLEEAKIAYEKSKENRRLTRREFEDELGQFSSHMGSVNILEKDPTFGVLKGYADQNVFSGKYSYMSDVSNYFRFRIKLQSLESRLNSNFKFSFYKNSYYSWGVKKEYS